MQRRPTPPTDRGPDSQIRVQRTASSASPHLWTCVVCLSWRKHRYVACRCAAWRGHCAHRPEWGSIKIRTVKRPARDRLRLHISVCPFSVWSRLHRPTTTPITELRSTSVTDATMSNTLAPVQPSVFLPNTFDCTADRSKVQANAVFNDRQDVRHDSMQVRK